MTKSTWKILKLDWKTPGKLDFFFFQKSGNPVIVTLSKNKRKTFVQLVKYCGILFDRLAEVEFTETQPANTTELYVTWFLG